MDPHDSTSPLLAQPATSASRTAAFVQCLLDLTQSGELQWHTRPSESSWTWYDAQMGTSRSLTGTRFATACSRGWTVCVGSAPTRPAQLCVQRKVVYSYVDGQAFHGPNIVLPTDPKQLDVLVRAVSRPGWVSDFFDTVLGPETDEP